MEVSKTQVVRLVENLGAFADSRRFNLNSFAIGYEVGCSMVREYVEKSQLQSLEADTFVDRFASIQLAIHQRKSKDRIKSILSECSRYVQHI